MLFFFLTWFSFPGQTDHTYIVPTCGTAAVRTVRRGLRGKG